MEGLTIKRLWAREVLDSRGNPTVEGEVHLAGGASGRAIVPAGASTGAHEALELRDGGERYGGKGVAQAVDNVRAIVGPALTGLDAADQQAVDQRLLDLDGTPNKAKLGANTLLAASLATAHAAAAGRGLPLYQHLHEVIGDAQHRPSLPVPMLNIINGGKHADNNVDIQEFMVVPHGLPTYREALRAGTEVYHSLRRILLARGLATAVGDEGGFAPDLTGNEVGIEVILAAIEAAGYDPLAQVSIALDSAADSFAVDGAAGRYRFEGQTVDSQALLAAYDRWTAAYPIISLEDPLAEDDWDGWVALVAKLGRRVQVVGDDIFVTNPRRIARGVAAQAANSVLVKINQIGTLSETASAVATARAAGWTVVISHRSGETEDTTIADLAVALGAGQLKNGAPCRSERLAKYNRLLRIEERLGEAAAYAGVDYPWRR